MGGEGGPVPVPGKGSLWTLSEVSLSILDRHIVLSFRHVEPPWRSDEATTILVQGIPQHLVVTSELEVS